MEIKRRKTRQVLVKGRNIGSGNPVWIQSMTNTPAPDVAATIRQIKKLEAEGCEIIRLAVPDQASALAISRIKPKINIPLVADIHFDYRLAIAAIENGADKIRLNPGNIRKQEHIAMVLKKAKDRGVPIRIGLNSGSVQRSGPEDLAEDMIVSCREYLRLFEKLKFDQVVISLKAHDVLTTVEAYRRIAKVTDAPLHLGITAAGVSEAAIVKSAIGIGLLLSEGIGDTIRVSLTADPWEEVKIAKRILETLELRKSGIEIISCPTCGRCTIDLVNMVKKAEQEFAPLQNAFKNRRLRVAIMGCVVNGPGEAKDADFGVAWGGKEGILFRKGQRIKNVKKEQLIKVLLAEVKNEMVGNSDPHA